MCNKNNGPITEAQIEVEFEKASQEEEEFAQFQLEEGMLHEVYPLVGGGYAIVHPRDGFDRPLGYVLSCQNPHGVFTPDGRQIGSTCHCEDYPCCGH